MARLYNKVQPMVYKAMVDKPVTRTDDYLLMLEVYKNFVCEDMSFKTVLEHHVELGLPSFASILRSRRKLQKMYPELVNATAADMRAREEKVYKAYALNR